MSKLTVEIPEMPMLSKIRYRAVDGAVSIPTANTQVVILYYDGDALISTGYLGTEKDPEFQPLPVGTRIIITV